MDVVEAALYQEVFPYDFFHEGIIYSYYDRLWF